MQSDAELLTRKQSSSHRGRILFLLFFLSLPLVNPWVRGDGVEYYAYVRSLVIDGDFDFENEWQASNPSFRQGHLDAQGKIPPQERTRTGHVANLASVGPSLLWSPFFLAVHGPVLVLDRLGAHIAANGYSYPYVITLAGVTALYAFVGLWLSFCIARTQTSGRWALLATIGIWLASSLPVYMYFNPFWSHAHSAFAVALFLWYWHRTRPERTWGQWIVLGLLGGLMLDMYYANGVVLVVPLIESLRGYWRDLRGAHADVGRADTGGADIGRAARRFLSNTIFLVACGVALLPTLILHHIIYGAYLQTGYAEMGSWDWLHPALLQVLFSSDHGLLSWTPILIPALLGLFFLRKRDPEMALCFGAAFLAFYFLIASYPTWDGISAFGGRFFVSMTPIFIVGLAETLERASQMFRDQRRAFQTACAVVALLIVWNLGFMFQWGMHLIPPRGPISWRQMAYNQVAVVPARVAGSLKSFLFRRGSLMKQIEQTDQEQLRNAPH
jgi:hypothetical protein